MKYEIRRCAVAIKTAPKSDFVERWEAVIKAVPAATMTEMLSVGLPMLQAAAKEVGRPSSGKQVVSLRLDPDVIAKYRATGPGWQARINEILRDHAL